MTAATILAPNHASTVSSSAVLVEVHLEGFLVPKGDYEDHHRPKSAPMPFEPAENIPYTTSILSCVVIVMGSHKLASTSTPHIACTLTAKLIPTLEHHNSIHRLKTSCTEGIGEVYVNDILAFMVREPRFSAAVPAFQPGFHMIQVVVVDSSGTRTGVNSSRVHFFYDPPQPERFASIMPVTLGRP